MNVVLAKDNPPWKDVKEYFQSSDTPTNRTPSPAKVNMLINIPP
jgi:hypothetical protein